MQTTYKKTYLSVLKTAFSVTVAVVCAVTLPQAVHALGALTGVGDRLGQMLLPMYLPVLILAFKTNAVAAVAAGALSPIVSFAFSGMPNTATLPFILLELICLGCFAALLRDKRGSLFVKIAVAQAASRVVRVVTTLLFLGTAGEFAAVASAVWTSALLAIPGYVLQLLIVSCFVRDEHEA